MNTFRTSPFRFLFFGLLAISLFIISAVYAHNDEPLAIVQERLTAVATYNFTGDIEQTLIPVANSTNIGQNETRIDTHFSGEKTAVNQLTISLRLEGGGVNSPAINLEQDGAKLYLVENGERTEIEGGFGFVGPTADQTAYLHAAENVRLKEEADQPKSITAIYEFEINGALFAEYMREQAQKQLPASVQSLQLQASPALQKVTGSGELWVDENGLPRRQILHLYFPDMGEQFEIDSTMQMDFQYDAEAVQKLSLSRSPRSLFLSRLALPDVPTAGPHLLVLLATLFFAFSLAQNRRWLQTAVPIAIVGIFVFTPILQTIDLTRYAVQQVQAESLPEALGLDDTIVAEQPPTFHSPMAQSANVADPAIICGDGSTSVDSDNDGLSDFTENCLGTDPYYFDSDRDNITDTLEVEGYSYVGQIWYSNPTDPDSNKDGIPDGLEWDVSGETAVSNDIDNDGIPNLWDNDNDGDGVPDNIDINPFSVTGYQSSFQLYSSRGNGSFNGYQYIQFQVQPEDESHLRYGTTPLDWPDDEEGNLQDWDGSTDDLYLIPYLEVRSNSRPEEELLEAYGVTYYNSGSGYVLYVPVLPISDGGKIVAFGGKVAYGPDQVGGLNHTLFDIRWESMKLIWMVQMNADTMENNQISTQPTLINTYTESRIRLAGLETTRNENVNIGWFGTPNSPTEDRDLFNLMLGMNSAFMNYENPDLAEVVSRFSGTTATITETWGVPAVDVTVSAATLNHVDELLSDTNSRVTDFLIDNNYPTTDMASLVFAMEQEIGWDGLDDMANPDVSSFSFNLDNIEVNNLRTLKMSNFMYNNGWQSLADDEILATVYNRYADLSTILPGLQVTYPDLTETDLRAVMLMLYTSWLNGRYNIITIDGQPQVDPLAADDAIAAQFRRDTIPDLPTYALESLQLGAVGAGIGIADTAGAYSYMRNDNLGSINEFVQEFAGAVNISAEDFFNYGKASAYAAFGVAYTVLGAVAVKGGKALQILKFGKVAKFLTGIAFAFQLYLIWSAFDNIFKTALYDYQVNAALAYAIVATVMLIVLTALSFTGIGLLLVGLLYLIDAILFFITGTSILDETIKAIASFFYSAEALTQIENVNFHGISTTLIEGDGLQVGSKFRISDTFYGHLATSNSGRNGDLYLYSGSYGYFNASSNSNYAVTTARKDPVSCSYRNSYNDQYCYNWLRADFTFLQAGINMSLFVKHQIWAQTAVKECYFLGFCDVSTEAVTLPDDLPEDGDKWDALEIKLDVLPATLSGLWGWSALTNHDRDGDGLLASQDSNDNSWDRDGDGLSDAFEFELQASLGTNPDDYDSDDDGLSDGEEYRLGTIINDPDSDDDGLLDGEEVFHWDGTSFTGGGWLVNINGQDYWVFADPLSRDQDNDGLLDGSEASNGTSPHAYNDAPQLTLEAAGLQASPTGAEGIYMAPGEAMAAQLSLVNTGPTAVTELLSLCLPAGLTGAGVTPAGDVVPPTQSNGNCYQWDFSSTNLATGQSFFVDLTASGAASTSAANLVASLPYPVTGVTELMTVTLPIINDATNPDVFISAPVAGELIGGGVSYYVVGGGAVDADSWVDQVALTTPSGTQIASGTSPWAYSWQLPADGYHTLSAQATDAVGNQSASDSVQVMVDNTAPTIDLAFNNGEAIVGSGSGNIEITLSGSASDNLSGLARVQASVNGRPWQTIWSDESNPLTANWSGSWTLSTAATAQGEHKVRVRAFDLAHNLSAIVERTLIVDVQAPTDEMTNRAYLSAPPSVLANQPLTLYGVANDGGRTPLPATPADLVGTLDSIADATVWLQPDSISDNDNGVTISWIGDFNGDRLADFAVGFPAAADGAGKVVIVNGQAGDWAIPRLGNGESLADGRSSFIGMAGAGLGGVIAPAGDVNGDGLDDLLIGDPVNNRVFLIHGRTNDPGSERLLAGPNGAQWSELVVNTGENVGALVSSAGDVNGDGAADILIGATTGTTSTVYLLLGRMNSLDALVLNEWAAVAFSSNTNTPALATVGDVNDDQLADFAIASGGTVYLFAGDDSWSKNGQMGLTSGMAIGTFSTSDMAPTIVALGDVNGDGVADFGYTSGLAPQVVLGSASNSWGSIGFGGFNPAASGFMAGVGDVDADGRGDLLLGNADGDAYLFLGSDLSQVQATISGVETAVSAPYFAGADVNADGSSDLLLLPSAATGGFAEYQSRFKITPIEREWLPTAAAVTEQSIAVDGVAPVGMNGVTAISISVDDDYCAACANDGLVWGVTAFASIQAAVNAASSGDVLTVQPGVYASFTISIDYLTIAGVMADAVFVDGGGGATAVTADNRKGISLSNMTIRNADTLISLADAGYGGWDTPADRITLNRLFLHDFISHAVSLTDDSAVDVSAVTLVGADTHFQINVDGSETDPSWTQILTDTRAAVGNDGAFSFDDNELFFANSYDDTIYTYDVINQVWGTPLGLPAEGLSPGSAFAADSPTEKIYLLRAEDGTYPARYYRYQTSGGWDFAAISNGDSITTGAAIAMDGDDIIYSLFGANQDKLYSGDGQHSLATISWTDYGSPGPVGIGSALAWVVGPEVANPGLQYALLGAGSTDFCVHSNFTNSWDCTLAEIPAVPGAGSALFWDGGDMIYAVVGGNSAGFYRYSIIGDSWETLPNLPVAVGSGGGMVKIDEYLYVVTGSSRAAVLRYGPVRANGYDKLTLSDLIIAAPETAPAVNWINATDLPANYNFEPNNTVKVGGDSTVWTPGSEVLSYAQTGFLNPAENVYRLTAVSPIAAGYHTYRPFASVGVSGQEFASIQAAINSGANRVLLRAGNYEEDFYLVSGVSVAGVGADRVYLSTPNGSSAPAVVTAEGVNQALLTRMTLVGEGSGTAVLVEDGTSGSRLTRMIVRDWETAVLIDGATSEFGVINNTILGNNNGVNAVNCGPVNVRNTLFIYNPGTALQYEGCATTKLHTYNAYWGNDIDIDPLTPGGGEIFLDPLFLDFANDDFRTVWYSPLINGGDPTEATPPGTGGRLDIGHLEQSGISYFVDGDYCEACENDGLIWQVDAFDTIAGAVTAAEADQRELSTSELVRFAVGVAAGTYTESVTISTPLWLVGEGAELVTINAPVATAVTFDGATHAGIQGFTIQGAGSFDVGVNITGASNHITVTRNLFPGNWDGVLLNNRGSGTVQFNTFVNNHAGVRADQGWAWATAKNNIFELGFQGLVAQGFGVIFSDYNLINTTFAPYQGVISGTYDIVGQDPLLTGTHAFIQAGSPAVDAAWPKAAVPQGGGVRADIGHHELTAMPVTLLLGKADQSGVVANVGVAEVEYGVVAVANVGQSITETLPTSWSTAVLDSPGESVTYWASTYTPLAEGLYRIYSRATDVVGNTETEAIDWYDGSFIVDSTAPTVNWLTPADGSSFASGYITLQAEVSDFTLDIFNVDEVYFDIDGIVYPAEWLLNGWTASSQMARTFYLHTDGLAVGGHIAKAIAVDKAGNQMETAPISFTVTAVGIPDTTPPTVVISSHADGDVITGTVEISIYGTGSDSESGIRGYEISMNGGTTWQPIINTGSGFTTTWSLGSQQGYSYPIEVRASDWAGNTAVDSIVLSVDNVPPEDISPIVYDVEPGYHLDYWAEFNLSWREPTDSSGNTQMFILVSSLPGQAPTNAVSGNSTTIALAEGTTYYVSLGIADVGGNQINYYFGPWYAGAVRQESLPWFGRNQTIYRSVEGGLDGVVDVEHWEWLTATEYLDDDPRPLQGEQSLYATWDGSSAYVGWEGGWWETDGTLWAYYDVNVGGTTQPISVTGGLPFAADMAVSVDGANSATLWSYDGSQWVGEAIDNSGTPAAYFAHNVALGETELRLDMGGDTSLLSQQRMIAFATDDAGQVWSSFPIANGLDGQFEYYYDWNISQPTDLLELPSGAQLPYVLMDLDSSQPPQMALGANSLITYFVTLDNQEAVDVVNGQLHLTGSAGLSFVNVSGATCVSCVGGSDWLLDLPILLSGGEQMVTVTAQLAADLSGIELVTTTAVLQTSVPLRSVRLAHAVDGDPPTVALDTNPGKAIGTGLQTFTGTTDDGIGIGVATVEVRPAGGSWLVADGRRRWFFTADPGVGPTWEVEVQATDYFGHSSLISETLVIDTVPPTTTVTMPALVGGLTGISGTATDPYPAEGQVEFVRVQVGDDMAVWQGATLYSPQPDSSRNWLFMDNLPSGDGLEYAFRFEVTDYAGNVTYTNWYTTVVDTVLPQLTAYQLRDEVLKLSNTVVLTGTVSDGGGLASLVVVVTPESGTVFTETISPVGNEWQYVMADSVWGQFDLELIATDVAGNSRRAGLFAVTVATAPVADGDSYSLMEDSALVVAAPGVLLGDSDEDGGSLSVSIVTPPANGTIELAVDGGFVYTPTAHFNGNDTFVYVVSDGVYTDTAVVTMTVTPVEDIVYVQDDEYVVLMDQVRTVLAPGVLGNDWEVDGDVVTAVLANPPVEGSLAFNSDGSFVYTPTLGYTGTVSFGYFADDGKHPLVDMHSDLVMHLPFDDEMDPTADISGLGHDGVLSGTVSFTQTVPMTVSNGSALWFSGQDGEAVTVDGLELAYSSITIAFWANATGTEASNMMFSHGDGSVWASKLEALIESPSSNPNTYLNCRIGTDVFPSREIVADGLWHHYACTFDYDPEAGTTTITAYEDGVPLGGSLTANDAYVGSGTATIGRWVSFFDGVHTYHGGLDEMLVYKRALSATEIAQLAAHQFEDNYAEVTLVVDTELPYLNTAVTGNGAGSISSEPAGIDCGVSCAAQFGLGVPVTLTAVADSGSIFMGWSGDCSGLGACVIGMEATRNVTATFSLKQLDLSIANVGGDTAQLSWVIAPGLDCDYDVYSSSMPYSGFVRGPSGWGASSYDDVGAIGDPAVNHYYYVEAVNCLAEGLQSGYVGEFDFGMVRGAAAGRASE
ncbi:MAG TPA: Ig-like domain-containing protein [Anaerolineae bacterium]|nr:Ig-like domain-containing protein [Anaerolineae bacterium]